MCTKHVLTVRCPVCRRHTSTTEEVKPCRAAIAKPGGPDGCPRAKKRGINEYHHESIERCGICVLVAAAAFVDAQDANGGGAADAATTAAAAATRKA